VGRRCWREEDAELALKLARVAAGGMAGATPLPWPSWLGKQRRQAHSPLQTFELLFLHPTALSARTKLV
jgi:hypothetical protein